MRITFFHSDKTREVLLAEAFAAGARSHGDQVVLRPLTPEHEVATECDVACMVGVKSKELFWKHWREGIHTIYMDKGYTRHTISGPIKLWEYWRVAVDAHHPTKILNRPRPSDRMEKLGIEINPWRNSGENIVFAGSSEKYHNFYGLKDPTRFAGKVVAKIKTISNRTIVYRPKPSWKDAVPVSGARYSTAADSIEDVLSNAHVLVTHGSNACFEAILMGVPCIIIGEAVAKPISSSRLSDVDKPFMATEEQRIAWVSSLMYCQWTMQEFATGEAWQYLRPQVFG